LLASFDSTPCANCSLPQYNEQMEQDNTPENHEIVKINYKKNRAIFILTNIFLFIMTTLLTAYWLDQAQSNMNGAQYPIGVMFTLLIGGTSYVIFIIIIAICDYIIYGSDGKGDLHKDIIKWGSSKLNPPKERKKKKQLFDNPPRPHHYGIG